MGEGAKILAARPLVEQPRIVSISSELAGLVMQQAHGSPGVGTNTGGRQVKSPARALAPLHKTLTRDGAVLQVHPQWTRATSCSGSFPEAASAFMPRAGLH